MFHENDYERFLRTEWFLDNRERALESIFATDARANSAIS